MGLLWIIDDEPSICTTLERTFKTQGHQVRIFSAAEPAIAAASNTTLAGDNQSSPHLIMLDVRLPGIDGLVAIERIKRHLPHVPVVLMTAFGDLPTAVRAMESKVFEYLTKPFDLDTAITIVERGLAVQQPPSTATDARVSSPSGPEMVGKDFELFGTAPAMQSVFKRIAMAAMTDCPVLIRGESGTGKELVARAIHRHSARHQEPYLAVAPVTMNPSLIESELFGHERGAFTGADQSRRGVFDLAGSGTILLDEIGDLPLAQQVKLLRVLEQREFLPVGSSKPREVKARVIAATHRDLLPMVAEGSFREDLYFRLAVFTIEMPALRQRQEDIIPLAIRFLQRYAYPNDRSVLSGEAIDLLEAYPWPGNVRELRNAMDYAAVLARGNRIHAEHLPHFPSKKLDDFDSPNGSLASHFDQLIRQWVSQQELKSNHEALSPDVLLGDSDAIADAPDSQSLYNAFLRVVEPPLLRAMLDSNQGNRAAVAKKLGLHRSTLRQKMRYHEMET